MTTTFPEVRSAFPAFTQQFEGYVNVMYLDTHEPPLVTIGVGNLIDPVSEAVKLPFVLSPYVGFYAKGAASTMGQRLATPAEITEEWAKVKSRTDLAHDATEVWYSIASMFLTNYAIDALVLSRFDANDAILSGLYGPIDGAVRPNAWLALHSMAWAMGPWFNFPRFKRAFLARDWATCSVECHMDDTKNPGLKPRNEANRELFLECVNP
jgi:GH24 family phage-related lysozyme (muramidase)